MKYVTFEVKTIIGYIQSIGVLQDKKIIDLPATYAAYLREELGIYRWHDLAQAIMPPDMLKFIEGGSFSKEAAQTAIDYFHKRADSNKSDGAKLSYNLNEVRLLAPVTRPISIRDCSLFPQHAHFNDHSEEWRKIYKEIPIYYRSSTTDIIGTDVPIIWPSYSKKLDYELEFGICIGKKGVNISEEKAEEYIFGYTLFNDISARDIQKKERVLGFGPQKGKTFENSKIIGPCLVTPDEINANNLKMKVRINGELIFEGDTREMYHKFPYVISYVSKDDYLYPGEFIFSGTVGGSSGSELNRWIKPGDVIELEADGIGTLRNKVVPREDVKENSE